MKNVALSADEALIEAARNRARAGHTTLNEAFRQWLPGYARTDERLQRYEAAMAQVTLPPGGRAAISTRCCCPWCRSTAARRCCTVRST